MNKNKIRVFIVKNKEAYVAEVVDNYIDFKNEMEIDSPIDIIERKIGGKNFSIVCDDEGLFKEENGKIHASSICSNANEVLAGNIIIMKHDKNGNGRSLTDNDLELIKDNLMISKNNVQFQYETSIGLLTMYFEQFDIALVYEV